MISRRAARSSVRQQMPARSRLAIKAMVRFGIGLLAIGLLMFLCAGTVRYPNGWLFLTVMFINMGVVFIYLLLKDPELLAKRLQARERRQTQQRVIVLSLFLNAAAYFLPGLDFRFKWTFVPMWLTIIALAVMEAGFLLMYTAIFQNRFASRVIEIQAGQTVIDTGLYSVVRHPMYMAMLLVDISVPLVLGSFIALIPMFLISLLLVVRIRNEEEMLLESLDGYKAYVKKVRYRLIPYVW